MSPKPPGNDELVEHRTEDSQTFDVGNGVLGTVFYDGAGHYRDGAGAWQPIDPTLVPATGRALGALRSRAGPVAVEVPAVLGAAPVRVSAEDASVAFSLRGAKAAPEVGVPAVAPLAPPVSPTPSSGWRRLAGVFGIVRSLPRRVFCDTVRRPIRQADRRFRRVAHDGAYPGSVAWVVDQVGRARVVFADRTGGVSRPPFHWANTGNNVGDDPEHVWENRRRVGGALGGVAADPSRWARVRVEHGATVATVGASDSGPVVGDAAITRDPNVVLSFRSADCGPLVLATGEYVALVHIGWRGFAAGVVSKALKALRALEPEASIEAALGPTIGACCYTLPQQSVDLIEANTGVRVSVGQTASDDVPVDFVTAIASILSNWRVGLRTLDACTACSDDYFSFRRDRERAGRQATVVSLDRD